ncbi:MAG TPA: tetratricopeptide repeat protein [Candidatus Scatovivens faecipullorum]|nr:tetratricopeptide repeat protein [Candidatus Scatovivens faecipullorum]
MFEQLLFNLLAVSLFIIIFFKIIRKNDGNYIFILVLQTIGIIVSFLEILNKINESILGGTIRYVFSIVIPLLIIFIEIRGINFSEILSVIAAKFFMLIGDTKTAKSILLKLVTKYPESYLGHKLLAECYEKEGGMRRAIDEYVTSVDINKKDYKSYFKIADLLRDLGKKDEAIQMLETLVKTKPDCYEASILLGELLCEQERFKEAANVYNEALRYKPADFDLYYNLGIVYTRLSDFQMAKEMYEKAAAINHRMYGANYNLGLIAFIQRDYDTAEKYFEKSLYGELEAMSYYQLAKIYVYKGEKDKAITFLNKAIELDPKLLQLANKEKTFKKIKEYITVSVKMDDTVKVAKADEVEEFEARRSIILKQQEEIARKYLDDTLKLIEEMSENSSKQKVDEKVDYIFNKEKRKKEKIQEDKELEEKIKKKEKEQRQKELGNN